MYGCAGKEQWLTNDDTVECCAESSLLCCSMLATATRDISQRGNSSFTGQKHTPVNNTQWEGHAPTMVKSEQTDTHKSQPQPHHCHRHQHQHHNKHATQPPLAKQQADQRAKPGGGKQGRGTATHQNDLDCLVRL